jgi:hypothetical protein
MHHAHVLLALLAAIGAACPFVFGAIQIKSPDVIAKKYAARGAAAGADYSAGVQAPRQDWAQATEAASNTWGAGVQQAISSGAFSKGVAKAGTPKWQRKASGVGATRYGPGVQAAVSDYAAGVAPYLDVLRNLSLPARAPKGDPGNINRVAAVAAALRAKKVSG